MTVEAYIVTWNRQDTIHLTIQHYLKLGRVVVYDNFSDDSTRDIAEKLGAEVRLFGRAGELNDQNYLDIKNHCWKRSHADWVIIVDDDEILFHENLEGELRRGREMGATMFHVKGYNIHSDRMPVNSWLEIMEGEQNENYSKLCCFNPQQVKDIRYNYGCHASRPMGNLIYHDTVLNLLHYRDVGGVERLIERHRLYRDRLSAVNRQFNLGHHYTESEESKRKQWEEFTERSAPLFAAG